MSFTYNSADISTNLAKVRLTIQDTDSANPLFQDAEINAFLSMNSDDVIQASAAALMAIANNRALLAKKKSAGKYSEDLSMIAKELREQAKQMLESGEPWDAAIEQTFGPLDKPFEGSQEKEFIERENLRNMGE